MMPREPYDASMTERTRALWPFVPYAVISVVHVIACFGQYAFEGWTKLLLMPLLVGAVVASLVFVPGLRVRPVPVGALTVLVIAIVFSWLGDGARWFFPMFRDELPMMLACFGIAHIAYVLLMWRGRGIAVRRLPAWSLVYVVAYLVLIALLLPHTKSLSGAVMAYGVLLAATAAMATRCGPIVGLGGALFLLSDAILAFRLFVPGTSIWTNGLVMLTYTLGQGLIAFGIVAALRRRDTTENARGAAGAGDPASPAAPLTA